MLSKIVLIDQVGEEKVVASFKNNDEAFISASLLQSMQGQNSASSYCVDFWDKKTKTKKRRLAESFTSVLSQMPDDIIVSIKRHICVLK